jgi:hypothetical protein
VEKRLWDPTARTARSQLGNLVKGSHQISNLMVLPCHELSSLSSPTWRPGWRIWARLFFGNECAVDVMRFSPSAAPVIAVNGIAVPNVGSLPGANNAGAPIVAINVVLKVDSTIVIVNGNTGNAVHKDA